MLRLNTLAYFVAASITRDLTWKENLQICENLIETKTLAYFAPLLMTKKVLHSIDTWYYFQKHSSLFSLAVNENFMLLALGIILKYYYY